MRQPPGQPHRAEIGKGVEAPPQGQQGAALGPHVHRDFFGLLMVETDRALENGLGPVAQFPGFPGKGVAMAEPGPGAECAMGEFKPQVIAGFRNPQNPDGLGHDFRPDAVPVKQGDGV